MKQVKSFEHVSGWGGVDETITKVNEYIVSLYDAGITDINIVITPSSRGTMYSVIYEIDRDLVKV